jgi:hypothetical protein
MLSSECPCYPRTTVLFLSNCRCEPGCLFFLVIILCYHLALSSCVIILCFLLGYHLVLSSCVFFLVIILCYHRMMFSDTIIPPFLLFLKTSVTPVIYFQILYSSYITEYIILQIQSEKKTMTVLHFCFFKGVVFEGLFIIVSYGIYVHVVPDHILPFLRFHF